MVHEYPGKSGRLFSWVPDLWGRLWTLCAPEFYDPVDMIPIQYLAYHRDPTFVGVSLFIYSTLLYVRNGS